MNFKISKKAKVLEIGSGHNPHFRSNILCDRYLYKNKERQRFVLLFDRPLVIADGCQLPFKDKAFDFVICSQVIEHLPNPIAFCQEIARVGKRGLIICPDILREKLFGWGYHRWFFQLKNDKLLVFRKEKFDQSPFGHFTHLLHQQQTFFKRFISKNENKLNIYYFWQNQPKIKITDKKDKEKILPQIEKELEKFLATIDYNWFKDFIFNLSWFSKRFLNKIKKEIRLLLWQKDKNLQLVLPYLCCPLCRMELAITKSFLNCRTCQEKYPIKNKIPILLPKSLRKNGY